MENQKCKIQLINDDGSTFVESVITTEDFEQYVQRCIDSSRFYAVLLVNPKTGQKANIGLQFTERNDSFDFYGALEQYKKYLRQDKGLDNSAKEMTASESKDFSLK